MSVYTGTSQLSTDQAAWDRMAYFAYTQNNFFDAVADVESNEVGSSVTFTKFNFLAPQITPLNEVTDVNLLGASDAQVTVTPVEYGAAMGSTAKLRGTSFIDPDRILATIIGVNAGMSADLLAFNTLVAGTNVRYPGGGAARVNVAAGHIMTANAVRRAVVDLRMAYVPPRGDSYVGFISPMAEYDLRIETGSAAWRDPHTYSAPDAIWTGETGKFEGVRFISTPTMAAFADAGVGGTVDVYPTIIVGMQALAKAWSRLDGNGPEPKVVIAPPVDNLQRLHRYGWYWLGAYGFFRQESVRRIETASSIGAN